MFTDVQRFHLANRMLDIVSSMIFLKQPESKQTPSLQGNIPQDDSLVDRFDKQMEESIFKVLEVRGDDNGSES